MKNHSFTIASILFSAILIFHSCKDGDLPTSTKNTDEKELKILLNEIEKMSAAIACSVASDWRFVPIGSKPCGGATHFVLYSSNIDTNLFLQKVAEYTQKQKAFNIKYQVSSDCSTIAPPKSIACVNEAPVLIY